jgi:hypothetical protein
VAQAVEADAIGEDHLRVISRAFDRLPSCVSMTDRGDVQASLVAEAGKNDVEIVNAVAGRIDEIFNPDGDFDEADRARRRGLQLGAQGADGMSRLSGWIDPETRCYVEAARPRCGRAGICPTPRWPRWPMTAAAPSAATTASNSGSRPASAPGPWDRIAGIRSP